MPHSEPVPGSAFARRHLAIVGPTACGKSAVALAAAEQVGGVEIVSVDSMQVYRGLDIGTAKPTPAQRDRVPHHLLDIADPAHRFTVARFAASAAEVLAGIEARGHTALLVGGTGLYLQAVLGDLRPPGEWPEVRARLEAEADADLGALYDRLRRSDPVAAARIHEANRRRIVRALEVIEGGGGRFSDHGPGVGAYPASERIRLIGVWLPRAVVATRIEARVGEMLEAGLLDEVRSLARPELGLGATARQALGYKELLAHVEDGRPLPEMIATLIARTRAFSVRQRRWFRRDPRIGWYGAPQNPVALVPAVLRELARCQS